MQHNRFRQFLVVSIALHLLLAVLLVPSLHKSHYEQSVPVLVNLTSEPAGIISTKPGGAKPTPATPTAQPVSPVPPVIPQPLSGAAPVPALPAISQHLQKVLQNHQPLTPAPAPTAGQQPPAHAAAGGVQVKSAQVDPSSAAGHGSSTKGGFVDAAFGSVNGPSFRKQVSPVYPSQARRRGREGVVMLRLVINEAGQLTSVEVVDDPGFGFADAAVEAVRGSSFNAARQHGRPAASRVMLPVRFSLQ